MATSKPKICWVCDVKEWAFYNRSRRLSHILTDFEHDPLVKENTTLGELLERVGAADIVVVPHVAILKYIEKIHDNKIVFTLTSLRQLSRPNHGILYYTDNTLDGTVLGVTAWSNLVNASGGIPIAVVSQRPVNVRNNICVGDKPRNIQSIMEQILAGLEFFDAKTYVFLAEHDVLYHSSHFTSLQSYCFIDKQFNCNTNNFRCTSNGYSIGSSDKILSQFSGYACDFRNVFREKLELLKKHGYKAIEYIEPGRDRIIKWAKLNTYTSPVPNVDIRHEGCISNQKSFMSVITDNLTFWGNCAELRKRLCLKN